MQFQDDYLVTARAGLTVYGQYRQAVRELMTRARSLAQSYKDAEMKRIDNDERRWKLDNGIEFDNDFEMRRMQLELDSDRFGLVFIEKRISELEVSFTRYWQQAEALKPLVGELTPAARREHERDYWVALLTERFVLSGGFMTDKLIRDMAAMPKETRNLLVETLDPANYDALKAVYLTSGPDDEFENLPLPDGRMDRKQIKALLEEVPLLG